MNKHEIKWGKDVHADRRFSQFCDIQAISQAISRKTKINKIHHILTKKLQVEALAYYAYPFTKNKNKIR